MLVARAVPLHLLFPQLGVRAGERSLPAMPRTAVPVVTVNEHRNPETRKHEVGGAALGERPIETKPCSLPV
jgi:hypothetical protein